MAEDTDGQQFIRDFFAEKKDGFLIDVGAEDGMSRGSMSAALLKQGWGGMLVEPLASSFRRLILNYQNNPKVFCLNVACSDEDGRALFHLCKGVSTLSSEWAAACASHWKHVQYKQSLQVPIRRLDTLFREHSVPPQIDFLQIDTEGYDLRVLKGMDWNRQPSLICVETLDMLHKERKMPDGRWAKNPEMDDYLMSLGYRLEKLTLGGNGIYVKEE